MPYVYDIRDAGSELWNTADVTKCKRSSCSETLKIEDREYPRRR